jgi:hypothetical protein
MLWAGIRHFCPLASPLRVPSALTAAPAKICANFGLSTVNCQLSGNYRIISTYRNLARNSIRISTCDLNDLNYLKNEHIHKNNRGEGPYCYLETSNCALHGSI